MKPISKSKYPYLLCIGAAFLCTFMTAAGTAISQIMELSSVLQYFMISVFLIGSVLFGLLILQRQGITVAEIGFKKIEKVSSKTVWYFIPLILIEIAVLPSGFSTQIPLLQYFTFLLFAITVGFNEEIYFRGIFLNVLKDKGSKKAIVFSSIIFGIMHFANLFSGTEPLYLALQMVFAFLVGFVLAEIFVLTNNIWILIAWHAFHDYLSGITNDCYNIKGIVILAFQIIVILIYIVVLWKKIGTEKDRITVE